MSLVDPKASLLATAWPALENEVRLRFEEWKTAQSRPAVDEEIASIAAAGESNLLIMPPPSEQPHMEEPTRIRRLPSGYKRDGLSVDAFQDNESVRRSQARVSAAEEGDASFYLRHQGGLLSRALGTAVHALLEELSRLRLELDWDPSRIGIARLVPKIAGNIRSSGVDPKQAEAIAAQALKVVLGASYDPDGQWILSPRENAVSEIKWTGVVENSLRTVRVDRVFRAGISPESEGQQAWWIIDYKTTHEANPGLDPEAALSKLRPLFAPQIAAYAQILRNLHGADTTLRAGLYYPRMLMLDWWEL